VERCESTSMLMIGDAAVRRVSIANFIHGDFGTVHVSIHEKANPIQARKKNKGNNYRD
jgi:hypothetical protein